MAGTSTVIYMYQQPNEDVTSKGISLAMESSVNHCITALVSPGHNGFPQFFLQTEMYVYMYMYIMVGRLKWLSEREKILTLMTSTLLVNVHVIDVRVRIHLCTSTSLHIHMHIHVRESHMGGCTSWYGMRLL